MRITKYLHSCLLVEDHGKRILIDPGAFSFLEGLVRVDDIPHIDAIGVTHSHPDHADIAHMKAIIERDNPVVLGSRRVVEALKENGIIATEISGENDSAGGFHIRAIPAKHESTLSGEEPENTAYLINGQILHPGDSFSDEMLPYAGTDILALPVSAPWTSELRAAEFAVAMRPKHVIPIHDGHMKSFFQERMYERFKAALEKSGTVFHPLIEPGETVTIRQEVTT
jgi:L-ascorbate metabolism protein UlaG (beta-lactamase superfamily)